MEYNPNMIYLCKYFAGNAELKKGIPVTVVFKIWCVFTIGLLNQTLYHTGIGKSTVGFPKLALVLCQPLTGQLPPAAPADASRAKLLKKFDQNILLPYNQILYLNIREFYRQIGGNHDSRKIFQV